MMARTGPGAPGDGPGGRSDRAVLLQPPPFLLVGVLGEADLVGDRSNRSMRRGRITGKRRTATRSPRTPPAAGTFSQVR